MAGSERLADDVECAKPAFFAHFVIRTSKYREMIEWYRTVLGAGLVFSNDTLTFLTYDEEHHRLAILNVPGLEPVEDKHACVDHVAYSYASLGDLLDNYERLKRYDMMPCYSINHGPTTSLYYTDPDGTKVEFQVDNFTGPGEASAFFKTDAFAANPMGVGIDLDLMVQRFRSGVDASELLHPASAPRSAANS